MGGDLRCFLGVGQSPIDSFTFEIMGESPWWRTRHENTVATAVGAAMEFLRVAGFSFLDDPLRLSPTEWRESHKILVQDSRRRKVHFAAPPGMELNRAVIICTRCHPALKGQPALQVRGILGRSIAIPSVDESLAFALEIKAACEAEGLMVRIAE
jgi:hypothetical protein